MGGVASATYIVVEQERGKEVDAMLLTVPTGEWLRPAPMPVTPHVSTAPRPLVLNEPPNTDSILSLSGTVTSSRHRLVMAARGEGGVRVGRQAG